MGSDTELVDWYIGTEPFDSFGGINVHDVAAALIDKGLDEESAYPIAYRIVLHVARKLELAKEALLSELIDEAAG